MNNAELLRPSFNHDQAAVNQQFEGIVAANSTPESIPSQNPFGLPTEAKVPSADLHAAVASSFDTLGRVVAMPVSKKIMRSVLDDAGVSAEQAHEWRTTAQKQYEANRYDAGLAEYAAVQQQHIAATNEAIRKQLEDDE